MTPWPPIASCGVLPAGGVIAKPGDSEAHIFCADFLQLSAQPCELTRLEITFYRSTLVYRVRTSEEPISTLSGIHVRDMGADQTPLT